MNQTNPENPLIFTLNTMESALPRIEDYLNKWAKYAPKSIAGICENKEIEYGDLDTFSDNIAHRLRQMGLKDGDTIAVLMPPSIEFLVLFLAFCKLGLIWLGINPKYTAAEIDFVINDSKPKLLIARRQIGSVNYSQLFDGFDKTQGEIRCGFIWHEEIFDAPFATNGLLPIPENPIAALVYTSGSTGRPKAARLSHKALIRGALVRSKVWQVDPFITINNVPLNHVGALGDICCTALIAGGCQVFLETFSALGTLIAIEKHKVSYWYQAPTMFEMCLLEDYAKSMDWSHLSAAIWSGGRASKLLINKLLQISKNLGVDYSMTESVGALSLSPLTRDLNILRDSVGFKDPSRNIRIMDLQTNQLIENSGEGEVQLFDEYMFDGYTSSEGNQSAFTIDGWFKTGDLVTIDESGLWKITGRCKEMFKSGGYNIYPREIEMAIESNNTVKMAAVVEKPDAKFGEVGVAYLVLTNTYANEGKIIDEIKNHCRTILANYKIPKYFIILESPPMLPIGKIDKAQLRQMAKTL